MERRVRSSETCEERDGRHVRKGQREGKGQRPSLAKPFPWPQVKRKPKAKRTMTRRRAGKARAKGRAKERARWPRRLPGGSLVPKRGFWLRPQGLASWADCGTTTRRRRQLQFLRISLRICDKLTTGRHYRLCRGICHVRPWPWHRPSFSSLEVKRSMPMAPCWRRPKLGLETRSKASRCHSEREIIEYIESQGLSRCISSPLGDLRWVTPWSSSFTGPTGASHRPPTSC